MCSPMIVAQTLSEGRRRAIKVILSHAVEGRDGYTTQPIKVSDVLYGPNGFMGQNQYYSFIKFLKSHGFVDYETLKCDKVVYWQFFINKDVKQALDLL